jgi:hypothetical protein
MVDGKWLKLYDGGITYGAPAHSGELKITEASTSYDGKSVSFANFEIKRINEGNYISIPTSQLQYLIDYLTQLNSQREG